MRTTIDVNGTTHDLTLQKVKGGWQIDVDGDTFTLLLDRNGSGTLVRVGERTLHVELAGPGRARVDGEPVAYRIQAVSGTLLQGATGPARATHVRPPMNGKLERFAVATGAIVAKGDVLYVLEAMKMHNEVRAPVAGRVGAIHVAVGAVVEPRQIILDLEPL